MGLPDVQGRALGTSLAEAVETASNAVPDTDPGGRLMAWGRP
jgi:hypothetical protein